MGVVLSSNLDVKMAQKNADKGALLIKVISINQTLRNNYKKITYFLCFYLFYQSLCLG